MIRLNIGLLASLSLTVPAFAAQSDKCMDAKSKPAADYLNSVIERMGGDPSSSEPNLVLVNSDITSIYSSGVLKNRVFVDGFVSVAKGYYRVVPGLGLTMAADNDSVVYICLAMDHRDPANNLMRIVHLDQTGIFHLFDKEYRPAPVKLETRPFGEASLLLGGLLAFIQVDVKQADVNRPSRALDKLLNEVVGLAIKWGVQQIDVRPTKVELITSTKVLGVDTLKLQRTIKYESKWLGR